MSRTLPVCIDYLTCVYNVGYMKHIACMYMRDNYFGTAYLQRMSDCEESTISFKVATKE